MPAIDGPVLIVGARSDIGAALAHAYAARGCSLVLAARGVDGLAAAAADLRIRHRVEVRLVECDVNATDPERLFADLEACPGTVVMVAGLLGEQAESEADLTAARLVMATNYVGPACLLLAAARRMRQAGRGTIIGISSVAGDRGRASNFVYGSAKAGFSAFLSGLRNRLSGSGVRVITVKPGFVATRMTAGMKLPPRLTARPEQVAEAIVAAQLGGRSVIYVKPIWRPIMAVIRAVPERVFMRMSL